MSHVTVCNAFWSVEASAGVDESLSAKKMAATVPRFYVTSKIDMIMCNVRGVAPNKPNTVCLRLGE